MEDLWVQPRNRYASIRCIKHEISAEMWFGFVTVQLTGTQMNFSEIPFKKGK